MASRKKATEETKKNIDRPSKIGGTNFYGLQLDGDQLNFANKIWDDDTDIVFVEARAGTGKTLVSVGVANMLVMYGLYDGIVYIMSPYAEKKQGWLPGTIEEKSSVYFDALYQAMNKLGINVNTALNSSGVIGQSGSGYITCITDTYLRGVNLENKIVIIDEAQNFTVPQLKKILTRVCDNSKVVVSGQNRQCDLDDPSESGFVKYMDYFASEDRCAVCELTTSHRGWISWYADEFGG